MTHIDLFSGIGGFTLAAEWVGFRTVVFCEKDKFCQKVLQKRFGGEICLKKSLVSYSDINGDIEASILITSSSIVSDVVYGKNKAIPIIPEIRDFDGTKWRGATLLTGGFPCQPFSVAGQRRGKEDDRYLWPEMLHVIEEARPRWIIAENVAGIVKLALGQVLFDLESIGYDFPRDHKGTIIVPVIPACGLNAPHRRKRVWIIAYFDQSGLEGEKRREKAWVWNRPERSDSPTSDSQSKSNRLDPSEQKRWGNNSGQVERNVTDTTSPGLSRIQESQFEQSLLYAQRGNWEEDWHEVATRFCRVDDGVSDRVHRLRALGNAIVPQIAYEIMKNIRIIEERLAQGVL